jgi:CRISPR system Cascade subunit CasE
MKMIASVLELSRQDIKALRITDPYSLHRMVYSLYDDIRSDAEKQSSVSSGILYADQGGDYKSRKILLLANRQPHTKIDGLYGEVRSKDIPMDFLYHTKYRFKVIVNSTKRDSKTKKLIAVRGCEAIAEWFMTKAPKSWGFDVIPETLQIDSVNVLQFKAKQDRTITMGQAHVQGVLQVLDLELFTKSFTHGIGRGRSYGCGLLQIVPLIENPFN